MTPQPVQTLLNELGLFYQDDNNIYHVIVKKISQDCLQGLENFISCDDEYDYEFFFQNPNEPTAIFYVTCKLLSHSLIVNLLNKEIYGMDFDVKDLKCRYLLTLHQKLSLEENLKQIIPSYFSQHYTPDNEMMLDSHKTLNSFYKDIDNNNNNQDDFGSIRSHDDYISHQNESGAGT
ncbi:hypothetical protein RhiirA1_420969 [Rhizophagus irregularis]|uniref:Uncharacterized protein n=3 Tax=Rhizophagus irregularis TaxID=588596 RepID=U9USX4_RHIID|nr:hypothetical protein GLOIN_2v1614946 [Rhizophagus irregularis DAOM 181602=DAOM 197198]EXX50317.1 hypothetical protein RirG_271990 [Rhizophagus irregularis DAOM 197198w]PKC65006.1 hypothetical protein RhiirA1_420969 [Rhizophagus irregularis]POG70597.1 hypothetical protein GLOIN_2v1614946 [Rhizophagus irregularis DAOM 181602=DAOM 197198]UZO17713.1 hypothetical protein OCT59_009054 [Rhizophagus irregularis]CAB4475039.1 unnamed protein product [Rhizophagus irregularis]|eukprot:XP_025177463.1 hypothetical protein GLOIN_2v1614946 [Rhizophagus irregularis DAOM 181602=DAOM 197198]